MITPPAAGDALAIVSAADADVDTDQLTLSYHGKLYVFGAVPPPKVQAMLMLLGDGVVTSDQFDEGLNFDNQVKYTGRREFATRMPKDKAHFTSSKLEPENATFGVTSGEGSQHLNHVDARPSEPVCDHCGINSQSTPKMRHGPNGPRNLCNACGLTWANKIPTEYTYLPQNGQSFSQQSQRYREALEKDAFWDKDIHRNRITGFTQLVDQRVTNSEGNGAAPSTRKATHCDGSFVPAIAAVPLAIYSPTECTMPSLEVSGGETPSKYAIAQRARRQREAAEKEARTIELSLKRQRKVDEHGGAAPSNYVVAQAWRQREEEEKAQRLEVTQKQQREVEELGGASLSKQAIAQRARRQREAEENKARRMEFSKNQQRREAEFGGSAPSKLVTAQHARGQKDDEEKEAQRTEFSQKHQSQEAEFGGSAPSKLVIAQHASIQNEAEEKEVAQHASIQNEAEEKEACGMEVRQKQQREAEEHGRAVPSKLVIAQRARRQREAEEKARRMEATQRQ